MSDEDMHYETLWFTSVSWTTQYAAACCMNCTYCTVIAGAFRWVRGGFIKWSEAFSSNACWPVNVCKVNISFIFLCRYVICLWFSAVHVCFYFLYIILCSSFYALTLLVKWQ